MVGSCSECIEKLVVKIRGLTLVPAKDWIRRD